MLSVAKGALLSLIEPKKAIFEDHNRQKAEWRARWDLNPGFSAPEADALSVLDYEPTTAQTKHN